MFQCCWVNQIFAVCEEMLSRVTKAAGSHTIQMGSAYSNLVSENITHTDPWLWSARIFMSSGRVSILWPVQLTFGQNEPFAFRTVLLLKQTRHIMFHVSERVCVFSTHALLSVNPDTHTPTLSKQPVFWVSQAMNLHYNKCKTCYTHEVL